ncbi:Gfo/Idh/MocA family protein [Spirosoma endophyticum]|uniref:Tat (Twin-arginine translocation) pathway signal sequence n=1 Tax=Spirosoma endophyticum TaxID=662367 RepID=A0A1I1MN05_9BACT|nr:Gfo/Idh/MocA family oxidoreductase [Spirosoma endophyticum]SFC84568.1 Tat (twin-arginine translocation) pathway signal sequence [Spirosoma endophyticum]
MENSRREFIKKAALGTAGITIGGLANGMSAKSYAKIIGANERLNVAIAGLGRRLGAYYEPIGKKDSNVELVYLCDVMKKQREAAVQKFSKHITYTPKLENDIRKVIADKNVDVLINATPDHWHAPGTWLAVQGGKHVYVEKPCSHNPREGEILIELQKKSGKIIQMGNQQRSSVETLDIIGQIHNGVIGAPYKAVAFYASARGEVPHQKKVAVPDGLDWELFQGPAPRREYTSETWDYNWHWYGWLYGTAEAGNNATHELDVARWALQVEYPEFVSVEAAKRYFPEDGWEVYDTMDATFRFPGNKIIKWDGNSRNGQKTFGSDRGTYIYGTKGTVYVDRNGYTLFDRDGKVIKDSKSKGSEAGTALGGGGDMTTRHIVNFFEAIRGKAKQASTIDEGAKSTLLCHLANIAYRTNKPLSIDSKNGHIHDAAAMKLWSRQYEKGWEPPM